MFLVSLRIKTKVFIMVYKDAHDLGRFSDFISYHSFPHLVAPVTRAYLSFLDKPSTLPAQSLCTCYSFCLDCSSLGKLRGKLPTSSGLFYLKEEAFHDHSTENRNPCLFL